MCGDFMIYGEFFEVGEGEEEGEMVCIVDS